MLPLLLLVAVTAVRGYLLADDRLGLLGWNGCALILAGISRTAFSAPTKRRSASAAAGSATT